ncbi:hypothetical protein D9Y22_11475 [Methylorubrum sp. DB1722]|nr:hypothetical protein [Methylorubrum sp. DB1722]
MWGRAPSGCESRPTGIPPPMRPSTLFVVANLCLAASPALAQGVPSNPFASNYPSAPPRAVERDGRLPAPRARRPLPPERGVRGLLPPAAIPDR